MTLSSSASPTHGLRDYPSGIAGGLVVLLILALALLAPLLPLADPLALDLKQKLVSPCALHIMGTDQAGRDILSRIVWGSRESLLIAVGAVSFGSIVGVTLGLIAGYMNGTALEVVIARFFDILFSIPMLVLAVALIGILGTGPTKLAGITFSNEIKLIGLIGLSFTPALGRLSYAAALVEAKSDYVRAKRAQGAGWLELIFVEIFPNAIPSVLIQGTLFIGVAIIVESSLSFVGLGVQPPTPSWGTMLADARGYIFSGEWWMTAFPGIAICSTVIGFNLLGDALRDALDPRKGAISSFV